jgi:putative transcriptional regulator
VRNRLRVLVAERAHQERRKEKPRRFTLKTVADETGISYYTLNAIANETIREYPAEVMAALCQYFACDISDLLYLEDVPEPKPSH